MELRARTVCELVLHETYYFTDDKVSALAPQDEVPRKPRGKNALAAVSSNFERGVAGQRPDQSIVSAVFELDCVDTPRLGTWCGMWHVHALASVIGQPIYSVYPNYNQYLRPAFHKLIFPREYSHDRCRRPFTIMWSRATEMLEHQSSVTQWSPNHFVPCFSQLLQSGLSPNKQHSSRPPKQPKHPSFKQPSSRPSKQPKHPSFKQPSSRPPKQPKHFPFKQPGSCPPKQPEHPYFKQPNSQLPKQPEHPSVSSNSFKSPSLLRQQPSCPSMNHLPLPRLCTSFPQQDIFPVQQPSNYPKCPSSPPLTKKPCRGSPSSTYSMPDLSSHSPSKPLSYASVVQIHSNASILSPSSSDILTWRHPTWDKNQISGQTILPKYLTKESLPHQTPRVKKTPQNKMLQVPHYVHKPTIPYKNFSIPTASDMLKWHNGSFSQNKLDVATASKRIISTQLSSDDIHDACDMNLLRRKKPSTKSSVPIDAFLKVVAANTKMQGSPSETGENTLSSDSRYKECSAPLDVRSSDIQEMSSCIEMEDRLSAVDESISNMDDSLSTPWDNRSSTPDMGDTFPSLSSPDDYLSSSSDLECTVEFDDNRSSTPDTGGTFPSLSSPDDYLSSASHLDCTVNDRQSSPSRKDRPQTT